MYNISMLRLLCFFLFLAFAAGCATDRPYNPVEAAGRETFLLNEALKNVQPGMTQQHVHSLMGQGLTVGYDYGNAVLKDSQGPAPITIPNPYRTKTVQTSQGECTVEYYVTAIHNPDGVISDDELMPLTFCRGILTAKGDSPQ